nr:MAG TPA: hypothetical protein [Caudoviricetes sp.]
MQPSDSADLNRSAATGKGGETAAHSAPCGAGVVSSE